MEFEDVVSEVIARVDAIAPDDESGASLCATAMAYFAAKSDLQEDEVVARVKHDLQTMKSAMHQA